MKHSILDWILELKKKGTTETNWKNPNKICSLANSSIPVWIFSFDKCSKVIQDALHLGKLCEEYMGNLCIIFAIFYKPKIILKFKKHILKK